MSSPNLTFRDIKIIDGVCLVVALTVTSVRLVLRIRSSKVWWDDALVFLAALFGIVMSTATGMHYGDPYAYSRSTRLGAYYLIAEGFYLALWTTRLSILYSIIRIVPEKKQKRFLYRVAMAFVIVLIFLLAQVFWVCEVPGHTNWKQAPNPQCSLGLQVAVCQLITDIIADILLIYVPVRLLTTTSLERGLKIRLVIIFSATILTTVVGLVHAAYLLEVRGIDAIVSALVEVAVCLIVCNLVVLVPALYRAVGWRNEDSRREEPSFKVSSFRFRRGFENTGMTEPTGAALSRPGVTNMSEETGTSGLSTEADSSGKKTGQLSSV